MSALVYPEIFAGINVTAFFTGKEIGTDVCGLPPVDGRALYIPIQKHTGDVHLLTDDLTPVVADAVVTRRNDLFIGVRTADCVPILLYDKKNGVVAAVHAGWRGTAKNILSNVLKIMRDEFSSRGDNILVAIGPSISSCCYEVGVEVIEEVRAASGQGGYYFMKDGSWYIDLAAANRIQAAAFNVPDENIWVSQECTSCLPHRFYSYRRSKETCQRQGGFIGIKEE